MKIIWTRNSSEALAFLVGMPIRDQWNSIFTAIQRDDIPQLDWPQWSVPSIPPPKVLTNLQDAVADLRRIMKRFIMENKFPKFQNDHTQDGTYNKHIEHALNVFRENFCAMPNISDKATLTSTQAIGKIIVMLITEKVIFNMRISLNEQIHGGIEHLKRTINKEKERLGNEWVQEIDGPRLLQSDFQPDLQTPFEKAWTLCGKKVVEAWQYTGEIVAAEFEYLTSLPVHAQSFKINIDNKSDR
jgi:hypothetical protein